MVHGDDSMSPRWYAVHTKPKQEDRAINNLTSWGIETLAPKLMETSERPRDGQRCRVTPLFPRYVFARFDATAMYAKVRFTRGVEGIVGFGEHATPIDDLAIALIRQRIQPDGFVRMRQAEPGDLVEVVDGPFRSLVGVFDRELSSRERVLILLTSIGSCTRLQVARGSIRKVSPRFATA